MCPDNISYTLQGIEMEETHNSSIFGRRTTDMSTLKFSTWAYKVEGELGVGEGIWTEGERGPLGAASRSAQPDPWSVASL